MNRVVPYLYDELVVRTVTGDDGEPWFVAADVCAALTLENTTKALLRLDADEQALISIQGLSRGNSDGNIINESGLYSLILGSKKAEAKRFKKWVTSEVLPSIRKTGGYVPAGLSLETLPPSLASQVGGIIKAVVAAKRKQQATHEVLAAQELEVVLGQKETPFPQNLRGVWVAGSNRIGLRRSSGLALMVPMPCPWVHEFPLSRRWRGLWVGSLALHHRFSVWGGWRFTTPFQGGRASLPPSARVPGCLLRGWFAILSISTAANCAVESPISALASTASLNCCARGFRVRAN
jgi:prophage antirepressor-like protein